MGRSKSVLLVLVFLILTGSAYAGVQLPILNASFEDPDIASGDPYLLDPAGTAPPNWKFIYYNQSLWGNVLIWDIPNPSAEFEGGIPDGTQVAAGSGLSKVVQIAQAIDQNTQLGDAYIAACKFGPSNTWGGIQGGFEIAAINDYTVVASVTASVAKNSWTGGFSITPGQWTQVILPLDILTADKVGKDLQLSIRAEGNICFDDVKLYKVTDNNRIGASAPWTDNSAWSGGLPAFHDYACLNNGASVAIDSAQTVYGLKIDSGSTLTVNSGAVLNLIDNSAPAVLLGQTGNANLIIDGGTINQAYQYGGDLKAGLADGSVVNIEMRSGQWNVRCLRLGESGAFLNWPDANSDGTVFSTVNAVQNGGTIDCTTIVDTGSIYVGDGAGSTVTYTMNNGILKAGSIRLCSKGNALNPSTGTFNLNNGQVTLTHDLMIGHTTTKNQSKFYQNGGILAVGGNLYTASMSLYPTLYSISGGTLQVTGGISFGSYVSGRGTFEVIGSAASISAASYQQNRYSTLKAVIGSGGISPIQISGTAVFDANAILDVQLGTGGQPGSYTLLNAAGGITDNGIKNWSSSCGHVTYQIVNGTALVVTYHADNDPSRCGSEPLPVCQLKPQFDFNNDCKVNFKDFAVIAANWMQCGFNVSVACP